VRTKTFIVALLLALAACSGTGDAANSGARQPPAETTTKTPTETPTETPTSSATPSSPSRVSPLQDGPVTPGRYRFVVTSTCDPEMGCPVDEEPPLPAIDVTVPDGWDAATEVLSLFTAEGRDTASRNGVALVLGWTNHWVGLSSQPCSPVSHQKPDITVGPTVADFVDAVDAHPLLDVTEPRPVKLGKYRGQFFSLTGPKDISRCEEWRPWDPGPYLQGEENRWDLWVMDVDGVRVVVMAEYFPETPDDIKADLRAMAESIRFTPATA
jgi:hypothetical protein